MGEKEAKFRSEIKICRIYMRVVLVRNTCLIKE